MLGTLRLPGFAHRNVGRRGFAHDHPEADRDHACREQARRLGELYVPLLIGLPRYATLTASAKANEAQVTVLCGESLRLLRGRGVLADRRYPATAHFQCPRDESGLRQDNSRV